MSVFFDALTAYQALMEQHRLHPDNEQLAQDMRKAKAQVETLWLEACLKAGSEAA